MCCFVTRDYEIEEIGSVRAGRAASAGEVLSGLIKHTHKKSVMEEKLAFFTELTDGTMECHQQLPGGFKSVEVVWFRGIMSKNNNAPKFKYLAVKTVCYRSVRRSVYQHRSPRSEASIFFVFVVFQILCTFSAIFKKLTTHLRKNLFETVYNFRKFSYNHYIGIYQISYYIL